MKTPPIKSLSPALSIQKNRQGGLVIEGCSDALYDLWQAIDLALSGQTGVARLGKGMVKVKRHAPLLKGR
jgi:hypothetical protein